MHVIFPGETDTVQIANRKNEIKVSGKKTSKEIDWHFEFERQSVVLDAECMSSTCKIH